MPHLKFCNLSRIGSINYFQIRFKDNNKSTVSDSGEDAELAAIKARVREMEEEREKIKQLHTEVDKQMSLGSPPDNIGKCHKPLLRIESIFNFKHAIQFQRVL